MRPARRRGLACGDDNEVGAEGRVEACNREEDRVVFGYRQPI